MMRSLDVPRRIIAMFSFFANVARRRIIDSMNPYLAAEELATTRSKFVNGLIRGMAGATSIWTRS